MPLSSVETCSSQSLAHRSSLSVPRNGPKYSWSAETASLDSGLDKLITFTPYSMLAATSSRADWHVPTTIKTKSRQMCMGKESGTACKVQSSLLASLLCSLQIFLNMAAAAHLSISHRADCQILAHLKHSEAYHAWTRECHSNIPLHTSRSILEQGHSPPPCPFARD